MSVLTGKCDICEKELLAVDDVVASKRKLRDCYSYYKVGEQNIFGPIKYGVYTKDICSVCYCKIMNYVDTLKPPKKTDEWDEAFEEETK